MNEIKSWFLSWTTEQFSIWSSLLFPWTGIQNDYRAEQHLQPCQLLQPHVKNRTLKPICMDKLKRNQCDIDNPGVKFDWQWVYTMLYIKIKNTGKKCMPVREWNYVYKMGCQRFLLLLFSLFPIHTESIEHLIQLQSQTPIEDTSSDTFWDTINEAQWPKIFWNGMRWGGRSVLKSIFNLKAFLNEQWTRKLTLKWYLGKENVNSAQTSSSSGRRWGHRIVAVNSVPSS